MEDDAGGDDFFGGLAKCGVISAAASSMMKFLDILEFRIRLEFGGSKLWEGRLDRKRQGESSNFSKVTKKIIG